MTLINCKDLCLGYDGKTVVEGLTFGVEKGSYLCIVGENGSGKSTLMKTMLGLRKQISGTIELDKSLARNEIGYLPQQTSIQRDFPASVREIVISGCLNKSGLRPFYTKKEKQRAADTMKRVGIEEYADRCYRELSGGQQQRVLLARALCATKTLLFLDEPVAGLDPRAMAEMYDIIEKLNREGVTIIMISHDIGAALKYATDILHIGNRPLFIGKKEDYLKSAAGMRFSGKERKGEESE